MSAKILLVDDEAALRRGLKTLLEGEGYEVRTARNGDEALAVFEAECPDVVLLDVMMPRKNGYAVCTEIRAKNRHTPVLFLTAMSSDVDQLRGFGVGADDYISKSAAPSILLARVRRALDWVKARHDAAVAPRTLEADGIVIDFDGLTVRGEGLDERLTKTEADFLWLLQTERGKVFSYDEIFDVLRGQGYAGSEETLYVHMSRLKRKLGRFGHRLQNERGIGYSLLA